MPCLCLTAVVGCILNTNFILLFSLSRNVNFLYHCFPPEKDYSSVVEMSLFPNKCCFKIISHSDKKRVFTHSGERSESSVW